MSAPGAGLGRASVLLASGTMVSRVLGFVKTAVLAAAIGQSASRAADSFALANQLPNNIYALIAGGLLSAVLVPQIVRAATQDDDGGQRFINKVVTLGTLVFALVGLAGTLLAPLLVRLYAQQANATGQGGYTSDSIALATAFAYWCLPQIFFYAMYSLLSEVLNARQVFGPFTWAPVINNVVAIAGLVAFMVLFGGSAENSVVDVWTPGRITILAGTASLGVLAQAGFLLLFWRRAGLSFRPDFRWRGVGLGATGKAAGWLFGMVLVTQLAGLVQSRVASQGSGTGASNAVLANSWLLFMLPHGIVAVSIATAYFTRMSGHASRGDLAAVRIDLSQSLRTIGMFMVFAAVAMCVVAWPFASFFESTFTGASQMAQVILGFMPGLVLFSVLFVVQRVFFALHDQRTPFFMQIVQSGIFVVGTLIASVVVADQSIAVAIAVTTSIAGSAQTIVALVLVKRRLGGIDGRWVLRRYLQFAFFAVLAGVVGLFVVAGMGGFSPDGFAQSGRIAGLSTVVVAAFVMAVVYFGLLALIRLPELTELTAPVLRRVRPLAARLLRR
ncbi:murein biosynthesis integral membrane protein MurJ [Frigoribacterium faeni]|uniref:murein biosynthesis integral membrane protein MurJ n=1 Tax=Frigoribacterium faeni TaxID=145483 RepID=UPI003264D072|nr:putative peptidoglycan lipid II flippase [Frigoribacterium faeni]